MEPDSTESPLFDASDEATGLESLNELNELDAMLAMRWHLGIEGVVDVPGVSEPIALRYLSVRGLAHGDEPGTSQWFQVHIGFPTEMLRPMLERWLASLDADQ